MKKTADAKSFHLPRGFSAAGIHAGIKKSNTKDMVMLVSEAPAALAATFTTNQVKAAPVKLDMEHLKGGLARAIVINSGNANACTGVRGVRDARRMAAVTAESLKIPVTQVQVCSTGHIGDYLPMEVVEKGIRRLAQELSPAHGMLAAEGIMTTDTRPKIALHRLKLGGRNVVISAMAKGAGMIEPNMATMLSFILTDADVDRRDLQKALSAAVEASFNRISVDGDRSTNDTVLCLANGAAGNSALHAKHKDWRIFERALRDICQALAFKIVEDGEGATRFVTVRVRGAAHARDADVAARAVARSFLVKTSWAGGDPNWGRIMDVLGYAPIRMQEERTDIFYDTTPVVKKGVAAGTDFRRLKRAVIMPRFTVDIDLNMGSGAAEVYTCDCTEEYVRINL